LEKFSSSASELVRKMTGVMAYPCGVDEPELAKGRFCRLCKNKASRAGVWPPHQEAALKQLAKMMRDSAAWRRARSDWEFRLQTPPSGYVYFGQLVDHDITKDNRYLSEAIPVVEEIANFRTARFDLESLYGGGPGDVPCLYEEDGERLRLGMTAEVRTVDGRIVAAASPNDLPRQKDGEAIIIDPRNDENLIVAQMQVLFIKFHNIALELLRGQPKLALDLLLGANASLLERARRFATWHYQWFILHDLLPHVVRADILGEITASKSVPRLFPKGWASPGTTMSMPVEFSVAAFRFGHSMVRSNYLLNGHWAPPSLRIIEMTKAGGDITDRLPADYVVDWDHFFQSRTSKVNEARAIAPCITEMMYELPKAVEFLFRQKLRLGLTQAEGGGAPVSATTTTAKMHPSLPEMTLRRGSAIGLPSGEEFASAFGFHALSPTELFPGREKFLSETLEGRTPLWYYILREAQVEYDRNPTGGTQTLGEIGSRIVGETIYQLVKADESSILNAGARWKPPGFQTKSGGRWWQLTSLCELAQFVAG
jgi:hypothetical protein